MTWSCTTPVVVSCLDDAKNAYITGESSLRMGMDVNGTVSNVWAFRFTCSSAFSPIEYCVAGDSTGLSVTLGLGERILNGELPELFMSNGYLVYKIQGNDDFFLLLDPVTGIVTDCALGINGVYCFHDQITDNQIELAQNLTSSDPSVQPGWLGSVGDSVVSLGSFAADLGTILYEGGSVVAAKLFAPLFLPVFTVQLFDNLNPGAINESERENLFNSTTYLLQLIGQTSLTFTNEILDGLEQACQNSINNSKTLGDSSEIENNNTFIEILQPNLPTDPLVFYVYGNNVGTSYTWLHVKTKRKSNNPNSFWIVECSVTYYINGKRCTQTQYCILLGGPLGEFIGDSYTFRYKLPYTTQGVEVADVQTSFHDFLDL